MIIVKNRELLIPNNERYIGTTYDNDTENRVFQVPRFSQRGVDLANLTFRLDIQYANESYDTVVLDKEVGEAFIILIWRITSATLQVPGTLYIGLRAIDDEATVKWSSFSAAMYAERHLNTPGNYGGSLTEIEQIEQDHQYMKNVINELKDNLDYAHDAEAWAQGTRSGTAVPSTDKTYHKNSKYYADQANTKATAAANSATAAANSATQAAATVADTNTRFNNAVAAVTVNTEVQDARVGADGTTYSVLKDRLDAEHTQVKNALTQVRDVLEIDEEIKATVNVDGSTVIINPVDLHVGDTVTWSISSAISMPIYCYIYDNQGERLTSSSIPAGQTSLSITLTESAENGHISALCNTPVIVTAKVTPAIQPENRIDEIENSITTLSESTESKINTLEDATAGLTREIDALDAFCREDVVETQTGTLSVTQGTVIPVDTKIPFDVPEDTDYTVTADFPATMFSDGKIGAMYTYDANNERTLIQARVQPGVQYTYHSTDAIQYLAFYGAADNVAQTGDVTITVQTITKNAESLESKINTLEDATAGLTRNVERVLKDGLAEVLYKINSGYIGGTGIISPAGWNKEVYTDKIDASQIDFLDISLTIPENKDMWLAVALYDSEESFISRVYLVNAVTQSSYNSRYTIPEGCAYVAFTYRTYGDAVFILTEEWNVNGAWLTDGSVSVDKITADIFSSNTVKSIAHRGDDILAPQCTAPAYIYARKRGFAIAENDLWTSEDGYFVMWHDTSLSRLGNLVDINGYLMYTDGSVYYYVNPADNTVYTWDGTDYVASSVALSGLTRCAGENYGVNSTYGTIGLNLNVLKRIDFGAYKGAQFKGTQILTFEEWVILCKKLGMDIYIDRKLADYTTELMTSAANIVKGLGMGDHASWLGLSVANIPVLRAIIPGARVGVLSHPTAASVEAYKDYKPGFFFNGDAKNGLTREAVQIGLNAGYDVETWYVGIESLTETEVLNFIETAIGYGVTAMTLDHYRVEDVTASLIA